MSQEERRALTYIEIDVDRCSLTYGTGACTAVLGTDGSIKCFNTRPNCQDPGNYSPVAFTQRFAMPTDYLPDDIACIPNVKSVQTAPTKLNPGSDIGIRESITITFHDHPYHDIGIDKYADERKSGAAAADGSTYDPMDQGTFWGKWRNRNRYFLGRELRLKRGYVGQAIGEMETRHYVIESVQGPSGDGTFTITAKDALKLADQDRAQAPVASPGTLKSSISAGSSPTTIDVENATTSDYDSSGRVRINDEVFAYTGVTDLTASDEIQLTGVTREDLNTTAEDHDNEDTVQQVLSYESEKASDIVYDLLTNYTLVPASRCPVADWNNEDDQYIGRAYTAHITEPTGVRKLVNELTRDVGFFMWDDVTTPEIRFRAIRTPGNTADDVTDDNIVGMAPTPKEQMDKRVSQVWVFFGLRNPVLDLEDAHSYRSVAISTDSDAGSSDEYDQEAIRKVFSRWIAQFNKPAALDVGDRMLQRFRDPPRAYKFKREYFEPGLETGDLFNLITRTIQKPTGESDTRRSVVLSFERQDNAVAIEAEEFNYTAPATGGEKQVIIDSDAADFNFRDEFDNIYTAVDSGDTVRLIIESGVEVYGTVPGGYAVNVQSWPENPTIIVENKGTVRGYGGKGGNGGDARKKNHGADDGQDGEDGGHCLYTRENITLINNVMLAGGGGGGGGGGAGFGQDYLSYNGSAGGGGGGGGAGRSGTGRGLGGDALSGDARKDGDNGSSGSLTSPGSGGNGKRVEGPPNASGYYGYAESGDGGDGGDNGQPGSDATNASVEGDDGTDKGVKGLGGAAGNAIDGDSYITYDTTGTITGAQVN